ncbi:hypothetical protein JCM10908_001262 [Rhodotorula pacifica]|uniref:uncharacterized protein n=1 Tax=Rhodotorula pacifica TaxID=1495444 RepID=UPI0031766F32
MPGLLSAGEAAKNSAAATGGGGQRCADKANLYIKTDADCTSTACLSSTDTPPNDACLPEIVVSPPTPTWPSPSAGLMLDFACQGWPSGSEDEDGRDYEPSTCAAILDRLSLSPSHRFKTARRPVAPDLVLRTARRDLLLQEIDAWSRVADERLMRWLAGPETSSSASGDLRRDGETTEAEVVTRAAAVRRRTRKGDVDLRVWVLHRAVGTRHALCSPEVAARPPWALLV